MDSRFKPTSWGLKPQTKAAEGAEAFHTAVFRLIKGIVLWSSSNLLGKNLLNLSLPSSKYLLGTDYGPDWRREWHSTPVFLPGEFHGQRSLAGYSPWGCIESHTTEQLTHTHTCAHTQARNHISHLLLLTNSPKKHYLKAIKIMYYLSWFLWVRNSDKTLQGRESLSPRHDIWGLCWETQRLNVKRFLFKMVRSLG